MTLAMMTYVSEGIVLASDSRQSITIGGKTPDGEEMPQIETVNSDSVYKTFLLSQTDKVNKPIFEVGVSAYGQGLLGGVSIASHIKKFSESELIDADDVSTIPKKIFDYFNESFPKVDLGFHIAGYRKENKTSVPFVYTCHIKKNVVDKRMNLKPDGGIAYGATWSGQGDVISDLINPIIITDEQGNKKVIKRGYPIIWDAMPLQDAIDFSVFAIRTTIETIRFQARAKNVGGPIDILVITPDGAKWIQRKKLECE